MRKVHVLIGRFQPLHEGHIELIRQAKEGADALFILVGSANRPSSIKNPWSYLERRDRIRKDTEDRFTANIPVGIAPINDYKYSDAQWCSSVVSTVEQMIETMYWDKAHPVEIVLVGHSKKGNGYLKYFPQWKYKEIKTGIKLNATEVRKQLLEERNATIPESVLNDYDYFQAEAKKFESFPYKATLSFTCADALVECAGHILLIQRKFAPGAGTWALPGGFKNSDETRQECAIRELFEETNIRVPEKIIRKSIVNQRLFDAPDRGCGIPRETYCVHIVIEPETDGSLPRANGRDDAMACRWVPINEIMNHYKLFDDHMDIIQVMTGASATLAINNSRINKGV